MSTPHVAGAVALLFQFKKLENGTTLTPNQIKRTLNNTGKIIGDSGGSGYNFSRIDIFAALASLDTIPPTWSNNATNNTSPKNNDVIQFNITCNDAIGLSAYVFSWNDTGSWVNTTNTTPIVTFYPISIYKVVTSTRSKVISWKFYCNDTNNNINMTDEWSFTVENTPPTVENASVISGNDLVARFDYSDVDNDPNTFNETRWFNNSKYVPGLDNLTTISSGNLSEGEVWLFSIRVNDGYKWSIWYNSTNITYTGTLAPTTHPTLTSVSDSDSDGNIEIVWNDDGNETGETYRLYRFSSQINLINISIVNITTGVAEGTQFYEDTTTTHGTTYWYALVTVDSYGNYNDSVMSNSLGSTANDTITPNKVTSLQVSASGDTATLTWVNVSTDISGNSDFQNLRYVAYYGANFNSSKSLANESIVGYSAATVSTNRTSISVTSSGTYHFVVTTLDDADNKNLNIDYSNNYVNASLTYTAPNNNDGGGGGGGSGGGGGGGGGGTSAKSPNEASRFFVLVTETLTPLMAINSPNIAVNRIGFKVNKRLDKVRINVKVLNESQSHPKISGTAYQYLELGAENLNESDLSQPVEIRFKVKNQWLKDKGITKGQISMYRYNKGWNKLDTISYLETNESAYYISYTPGFSVFAISATEQDFTISQSGEVVEGQTEEIEQTTPAITEIEGGGVEKSEHGFFIITGKTIMGVLNEGKTILLFLMLALIALIVWLYIRKK